MHNFIICAGESYVNESITLQKNVARNFSSDVFLLVSVAIYFASTPSKNAMMPASTSALMSS